MNEEVREGDDKVAEGVWSLRKTGAQFGRDRECYIGASRFQDEARSDGRAMIMEKTGKHMRISRLFIVIRSATTCKSEIKDTVHLPELRYSANVTIREVRSTIVTNALHHSTSLSFASAFVSRLPQDELTAVAIR